VKQIKNKISSNINTKKDKEVSELNKISNTVLDNEDENNEKGIIKQ